MSNTTGVFFSPSEDTFDDEVLDSPVPVLVFFWAPWCSPCQTIKPAVESLADAFGARVSIAFVNVDDHPDLVERIQIRSIPALRMFRDGRQSGCHDGAASRAELIRFVRSSLSSGGPTLG